jgi:DNA-binding XRE family transcriptional regulator
MSTTLPSPQKPVAIRRDPSGGMVATVLRRTLAQNKALLKSKAHWAKLAGVPYGTLRAAFDGGRFPPSALDAVAAVVGLDVAEMIQAAMADEAEAEAAVDAASFGRRLRMLGRRRGLSDSELAGRLGISTTRYGHYTRGRNEPSLAMIRAICQVLDLSPNELLGYGGSGRRADRALTFRSG